MNKKIKRKLSDNARKKIHNIFLCVVFLSFVGSLIYSIIRLILSPTTTSAFGVRTKSDYVLVVLQCALGILAMFLPGFLSKKIKIEIPSKMIGAYALFLYCAIYLGEMRSFYYKVPYFDVILHAFSGMMLGALGFSLISLLNNTKKVPVNLSPAFVLMFTVCFAVTVGVLWEVYEFSADLVLGTNMQKFATYNGTVLVGNKALYDTMKDLITDFLGALFIAIIGYISQKHKTNYLKDFMLKKKKA